MEEIIENLITRGILTITGLEKNYIIWMLTLKIRLEAIFKIEFQGEAIYSAGVDR